MEVFVHNLPVHLSKNALRDQLASFTRPLGITDYDCEKPRKKRYGHILFLRRSDGEAFLNQHGEVHYAGHPRPLSRLNILGSHVLCKRSTREPDEFALRSLRYEIHDRDKPTRIVEEESGSIAFSLMRSSCGYTTFDHDDFVYSPEVNLPEHGSLFFKKRNIVVVFGDTQRMRIPLNTVFEVVWFTQGSLLITLMTVPLFFREGESSRIRLSSLGGSHSEIVGQCLVYEFTVDPSFMQKKMNQLQEYDLTVIRYEYRTMRLFESWQSQLITLKAELADHTRKKTLPFWVLFQMQALVYNGYLPPFTVSALTRKLTSVFKSRKTAGRKQISVNVLKRLFNLINWPSPFGNPNEYSVQGLMELVTGTDKDYQDGVIQPESLFSLGGQFAYIHRLTVTPSRLTLHGPEVEPMNRILRRFPNHHEYFVRVQFCDENGQDVHFNPRVNNSQVFERFKYALEYGMQIAGRTYTFLGFSHSSLRTHSAWVS